MSQSHFLLFSRYIRQVAFPPDILIVLMALSATSVLTSFQRPLTVATVTQLVFSYHCPHCFLMEYAVNDTITTFSGGCSSSCSSSMPELIILVIFLDEFQVLIVEFGYVFHVSCRFFVFSTETIFAIVAPLIGDDCIEFWTTAFFRFSRFSTLNLIYFIFFIHVVYFLN